MGYPSRASQVGLAALVVVALALGGCADQPVPTPGKGWDAEIAQALEMATSDFEREVLADGEITAAENNEAHQLWLSCIQQTFPEGGALAVAMEPQSDGSLVVSATGFDAEDTGLALFESTMDECAIGTTSLLAPLYNNMNYNPENRPIEELIAECLVRNGVREPGYTAEEFIAETADGGAALSALVNDERGKACLTDPTSS